MAGWQWRIRRVSRLACTARQRSRTWVSGAVASRVVAAKNVREALLLVARSEASLGIVYATDAVVEPGVRVIGTLPLGTYPPIIYPVALTSTSDHRDATELFIYLRSAVARAVFQKAGFKILEKA